MEQINLNLVPNGLNPICHCSQYDVGRVIRVNLFDGSVPYAIASGDTITLNVRKPDNTIVTTSLTATEGNSYVDIVTSQQMCACAGINLCDLSITNNDNVIGTLNFIMEVERDVLSDGIPSESVIKDLAGQIHEIIDDDYYTKPEVDALLDLKADKTEIYELYPIDEASGTCASFEDGADNAPIKGLTVEFNAKQAAGTPTPSAPLPISGVSSIEIKNFNKNYFNKNDIFSNTYIDRFGVVQSSTVGFTSNYIPVKENTKYYESKWFDSEVSRYVAFYDANKALISAYLVPFSGGSFTTPANTCYVRLSAGNGYLNTLMLTPGSSAKPYEPYNSNSYVILLGDTYFGGRLIYENGEWAIEATFEILTLDGTERISLTGAGTGRRFRFDDTFTYNAVSSSSHFIESIGNSNRWGYYRFASGYLLLTDNNSQMADETAIKTWLSDQYSGGTPVQFKCELSTPVIVPIDNDAVITTFKGLNNICADSGDIDVIYRADIGLYIDKKLGEITGLRSLSMRPQPISEPTLNSEPSIKNEELTKEANDELTDSPEPNDEER